MRLIGAGLPRTGTLTQKVALEMLGVGPCYHMVTVLAELSRARPWQAALDGRPDWEEIFEGFASTVDWPGAFFYRTLIDVYPDAKVLLSVRDPGRWASSMGRTVLGANRGENLMHLLSGARAQIDPDWKAYNAMAGSMLFGEDGLIGDGPDDEAALAAVMRRYNAEVIATVPSDRLLVWEACQGWEPLCEFIGVDVPEAAFPNVNDSAMFEDRIVEGCLTVLNEYSEKRKVR